MSNFTVKRATRQGIKPLIGIYSESGCGKTMSSLLLARGFVGPSGKIVMIDTENGRGSLYADVIPGGYEVLELSEPFSPARHIEAIDHAENSGADIIVWDSASHEWENIGGVCDMAAQSEKKNGKGLHNWNGPKMEHQKLVLKLARSKIPIIICIRAKYKTRSLKGTEDMVKCGAIHKDQIGRTVILKDDYTTPIQADDFIFEMTAHGEILHDHSLRLTKCSHPALRACFPEGAPITVEHGQKLAAWCAAPTGTNVITPFPGRPNQPSGELSALKSELWALTKNIHMGKKENVGLLQQWLIDEAYIDPDDQLDSLSADRLRDVLARLKARQS